MNWVHTLLVLGTAFLAVFAEAAFSGFRDVLRTQIDFLPPLMVYASLSSGLVTVSLLACCGGLWLDSLSVNPLGVSILPLFLVGVVIHFCRELILRDQPFAQAMVGLGASAAVPTLTLVLLLTSGHRPLLGWGTLWQLGVMSVGGALATPVIFILFARLQRWLVYGQAPEPSFRPDREIRRGR